MAIEKTVNFLSDTLRWLGFSSCELIYEEEKRGLTRFAGDRIHQTSDVERRWLTVRYFNDGKIGIARTTCFDQASIAQAAHWAETIAHTQPEGNGPVGLPPPSEGCSVQASDEATAHAQAFERAQLVRNLVDRKSDERILLSGAIVTRRETLAVVSSAGVRVFEERTRAETNIVAQHGGTTGRSYWCGWRLGDAPFPRMLEEAVLLAKNSVAPADPPEGKQTVVLDYLAAGQLVGFLGYLGFGAKAFLEQRSFLVGAMGESIASPLFTLVEDPTAVVPVAFDYHGMPRQRVILVDRGVACGLVTDWFTGRRIELGSSGHAPAPDSTEGPLPGNLVVACGDSSVERLCSLVENGIYVRDLHYVNVVEPITTTITGMTRHGVFRIRAGQMAEPVRNARFQVRILDVLKALVAIGHMARPAEGPCGIVSTPALASEHFIFEGAA